MIQRKGMAMGGCVLLLAIGGAPTARAESAPVAADAGTSAWTIAEASRLALARQSAFRIERLRPAIARTREAEERAFINPELTAEMSANRSDVGNGKEAGRAGSVAVGQTLPTGTRWSAGWVYDRGPNPQDETRILEQSGYSVTLTQPLLQGRGTDAQRARWRLARLDTRVSEAVLRAAADALVAQVEQTAWNYVLAGRRIAIYEESLRVAEDQRKEVEERIRIGRLADIEWAAVAAEVAQRREDLINARADCAKKKLEFLRLIGVPAVAWDGEARVSDEPAVPNEPVEPVGGCVERAMAKRPDLEEARLLVERGDVDVVRTRNGLLPKLDFFIALGRSKYSDSFNDAGATTDRTEDVVEAGLRWTQPLGRVAERAAQERSLLTREQTVDAMRNMEELAQMDVREAHIEALRTLEQIAATQATRQFREESFRAETEKLRVGRSTSILVAQAQRDLVAARISEVEAVVNHMIARMQLQLADGSLLESRGIEWDASSF